MIALLDINVLLAMLWPRHTFFQRASQWFGAHRAAGWATCPATQAGFVRLYAQRSITGMEISSQEAMEVLASNCAAADHVFWPQESPVAELLPEIRARLMGHKQLADAVLLDLAIRKAGRLATLDGRVVNLLPPDSPHRRAIEVISI